MQSVQTYCTCIHTHIHLNDPKCDLVPCYVCLSMYVYMYSVFVLLRTKYTPPRIGKVPQLHQEHLSVSTSSAISIHARNFIIPSHRRTNEMDSFGHINTRLGLVCCVGEHIRKHAIHCCLSCFHVMSNPIPTSLKWEVRCQCSILEYVPPMLLVTIYSMVCPPEGSRGVAAAALRWRCADINISYTWDQG